MTRKPRLSLEALEAKVVPQGTPTPVGISLSPAGVLSFGGTDIDDAARVWVVDGQVRASMSHTAYKTINGQTMPLTINDPEQTFAPTQVKSIEFLGGAGNDWFENDTGIKSSAWGGAGADHLAGGGGNDLLVGNGGDDTLEGRGGDDDLRGG